MINKPKREPRRGGRAGQTIDIGVQHHESLQQFQAAFNARTLMHKEFEEDAGRREIAFRHYINTNKAWTGTIGVHLRNWITMHNGADWARRQAVEYAEGLRAERGLAKNS